MCVIFLWDCLTVLQVVWLLTLLTSGMAEQGGGSELFRPEIERFVARAECARQSAGLTGNGGADGDGRVKMQLYSNMPHVFQVQDFPHVLYPTSQPTPLCMLLCSYFSLYACTCARKHLLLHSHPLCFTPFTGTRSPPSGHHSLFIIPSQVMLPETKQSRVALEEAGKFAVARMSISLGDGGVSPVSGGGSGASCINAAKSVFCAGVPTTSSLGHSKNGDVGAGDSVGGSSDNSHGCNYEKSEAEYSGGEYSDAFTDSCTDSDGDGGE